MKRIWLSIQVALYWLVMSVLYIIVAPFYIVYKLGISRGKSQ